MQEPNELYTAEYIINTFFNHIEICSDNFEFIDNQSSSKIPKRLHLIWVGDRDQPEYLKEYMEKWSELMPDWSIRLWTNSDLTLEEFSNETLELLDRCKIGAQKADILRYFIIEKYGGVYLDVDIKPHRSLDPIIKLGRDVVLCHDCPLSWPYIAIGFFAATPHHPLFKAASETCFHIPLNTENIQSTSGPRLLGDAIFKATPPFQKYLVIPHFYFYRNLKGDKTYKEQNVPESVHNRESDFDLRFGNHFYAKMW